jgi:hypothetical protein
MSYIPSIKCPVCGARIPMNTPEAKYTFKFLRCMACATEELTSDYQPKIKDKNFVELLSKAFYSPSELKARKQEVDIMTSMLNTEAIKKAIDKALDEGNKEEFFRLTKLLKGGDAEK